MTEWEDDGATSTMGSVRAIEREKGDDGALERRIWIPYT